MLISRISIPPALRKCAPTSKPLIVSTPTRHFYDIERNISDEQIKMIGARGGVIGINAILVSAKKEEATLDRYVDPYRARGESHRNRWRGDRFRFCEFVLGLLPAAKREELEAKLTRPHYLPDLRQSCSRPQPDAEVDRARF